jgi:hypothetical protein
LFFMKFHWNFMKKKGPLNEIKALLVVLTFNC